jgi:nucleotide-binding universal stress UspA family protein
MKRIVVPVDGSKGAAKAARFAAELAAAMHAELVLLHVFDAPAVAQMGLEALDREGVAHAKEYVAKGSFDAARAAIGDIKVSVTTHSELGHPAHGIVAFAEGSKADLVVMGTRGRSEIAELLLGSVSEYVIRNAPCPVTVVR